MRRNVPTATLAVTKGIDVSIGTLTKERSRERARLPSDQVSARVELEATHRDDRWLVFATVMLGLAGALGFISGEVALGRPAFFVAGARFVFGDLETWGWIAVLVGWLVLMAAVAVTTRSEVGRWFGISIAALQVIAVLMMIQSYPFWCLSMFALDVLAIFALAMYRHPPAPESEASGGVRPHGT
jgi:hypothetical protein